MYHYPSTSCLYKHSFPSQALTAPGNTPGVFGSTPPQEPDNLSMLNRHERVAMKLSSSVITRVSPQTLTIAPPRPTSPTPSDADSEYFDDSSNSPCSSTGEECPDLCGGFKNACRSWTPPASPFYYTDEGGIFLLDDRRNYEERQKIELEHTLHDLDTRLQRLKETMSPPRCLNHLHESSTSTPSSPSGKFHGNNRCLLRSPSETLAKNSHVATISPRPSPCVRSGPPRHHKLFDIQHAPTDSLHSTIKTKEIDETGTADLGKLIHTSLQHVQSTNSPPRYLTNVSETEAQPLPTEPMTFPTLQRQRLRDGALSTCQTSFGNTAYPTPLPSSPESKPSRKRRRDDDACQEGSGRKRRREEDNVQFTRY